MFAVASAQPSAPIPGPSHAPSFSVFAVEPVQQNFPPLAAAYPAMPDQNLIIPVSFILLFLLYDHLYLL